MDTSTPPIAAPSVSRFRTFLQYADPILCWSLIVGSLLVCGWKLHEYWKPRPPLVVIDAPRKLKPVQATPAKPVLVEASPALKPQEVLRSVDVNQAPLWELTTLPGIGETLAERIITSRKRHGHFTGPEDLLRVYGVGPKKLVKLLPHLKGFTTEEVAQTSRDADCVK